MTPLTLSGKRPASAASARRDELQDSDHARDCAAAVGERGGEGGELNEVALGGGYLSVRDVGAAMRNAPGEPGMQGRHDPERLDDAASQVFTSAIGDRG